MPTRDRIAEIKLDVLAEVLKGLLFKQDKAADIHKNLLANPKFEERKNEIGTARKTERLVKEIRDRIAGSPSSTRDLDTPFEWHRLEEYGLPWESGEYLLKMSCRIQQVFVALFRLQVRSSQETPDFRPTVRQVRWWWRVHLAVSEEKATYEQIYSWAEEYARQELYKDVLGRDMDMSGEDAFLTYRAAFGADFWEQYSAAVEDGRIPDLPRHSSQLPEYEDLRQRGIAVSSTHSNLSASGGSHSYLEGALPMPEEFRDAHNLKSS